MAVLSMSKQEFSRLDVLLRVQSGRVRVTDARALIGPRRRQVFRLLRDLKQSGATSLLSKHRGKPSNHRSAAPPALPASAAPAELQRQSQHDFEAERMTGRADRRESRLGRDLQLIKYSYFVSKVR
jgi:hypothetical protein